MNIKFGLTLVTMLLTVIGSRLIAADDNKSSEELPAYIEHQSEFVQQVYSKVLIGFAFERKCSFLEKSDQNEYEKLLDFTSEIFQGYLLGKELVLNAAEASDYTKDMVFGAIRYASVSNCDSVAEDRVELGFETAQEFMSLVDSELKDEI